MSPAAVAALAAAAAVVLLHRPAPDAALAGPPGAAVRRGLGARAPRRTDTLVLGAAVAGAVVLLDGTVLVVTLVVGAAALGGRALLRRRRAAAAAAANRDRVLALCDLVAAELRAGRPPSSALTTAAREWPQVDAVRRADALGADVVTAWRQLADQPGAGDLRLVAAAWQVTRRTGAGLAEALTRVAGLARATQATRRVVASELASARATARLMAGLPVVALLMGGATGGNPWHFLLATPLGLACLAGGLACGFAGLWWIEAIADDVTRSAG
ncbi:type II secretion system F family protein [Nocardioides alkalitolerans]|uniref:type II secretion system F family protein n=1 Tax=Nocardioides alkalitolerans TaxID=281714 RepID=UPI0003FA6FBB|nr:type II secretion system F family protein [Nocardioides alkalitolerans]